MFNLLTGTYSGHTQPKGALWSFLVNKDSAYIQLLPPKNTVFFLAAWSHKMDYEYQAII